MLLLVGLFFLVLQTALFLYLPFQEIKPDFILILVIHMGFSYSFLKGGVFSFILGYLMDTFSGSITGLYTFLKVLLFFLSKIISKNLFLNNLWVRLALVFFFSLGEGLVLSIFLKVLFPERSIPLYFPKLIFFQSLFNTALSPLIFYLLSKEEKGKAYEGNRI